MEVARLDTKILIGATTCLSEFPRVEDCLESEVLVYPMTTSDSLVCSFFELSVVIGV